ncbi:MAG: hypothetical protein WC222_05560 [Parachlamydiales bacterium]
MAYVPTFGDPAQIGAEGANSSEVLSADTLKFINKWNDESKTELLLKALETASNSNQLNNINFTIVSKIYFLIGDKNLADQKIVEVFSDRGLRMLSNCIEMAKIDASTFNNIKNESAETVVMHKASRSKIDSSDVQQKSIFSNLASRVSKLLKSKIKRQNDPPPESS